MFIGTNVPHTQTVAKPTNLVMYGQNSHIANVAAQRQQAHIVTGKRYQPLVGAQENTVGAVTRKRQILTAQESRNATLGYSHNRRIT